MKKPNQTSRKNDEPTLEALTTARARREAQRLGVPLSAFVAHLAAKADRMPVTVMIKIDDIHQINRIAEGRGARAWIERLVDDVLEGETDNLSGQN